MRTVNPEQHARKRAAILAAAEAEFAAHGLDAATTADICRRTGIGSGTLFHYFATKREIFHAVFAEALARHSEVCTQALRAESAETGLELVLDQLVGDLSDPNVPGLAAAAMLQANRDTEFAAMLAADEEQTLDTLTALLTRMAAEGHRLTFPPARVARWITTIVDATMFASGGDDVDPTTHARELRGLTDWLLGRTLNR